MLAEPSSHPVALLIILICLSVSAYNLAPLMLLPVLFSKTDGVEWLQEESEVIESKDEEEEEKKA